MDGTVDLESGPKWVPHRGYAFQHQWEFLKLDIGKNFLSVKAVSHGNRERNHLFVTLAFGLVWFLTQGLVHARQAP